MTARDAAEALSLKGRAALVTGASRGIGAAIARGFAAAGACVVVSSRKQEAVERVASELRGAGHEATAVGAHVGEADAVRMLVERCVEAYGGLDVVVNNAAVNPVLGPLAQVEPPAFDKVFSVNVKGAWAVAKAAYPVLCRRGGGAVINVSSIAGLKPEPMLGLYSASKAALNSLTQALALEWAADKIRVNAICPGLVQTRFSSALWQDPQRLEQLLDRIPLRRMAQPDEIVPLAVFLASDAGSYCTGALFTIDGGALIA